MPFEAPQHKQERYTRPHKPLERISQSEELARRETLQNTIFEQYVQQQLIDDFFERIEEYNFSDEQISEMQDTVTQLDDAAVLGALSLPFELRERWYQRTEEEVTSGHSTPADAIRRLAMLGSKYGFTIGYHTSPNDILPNENGRWEIKGTEMDHRDDDLTMAYYSNQYRHLFKKKGPRYIYVVRAEKEHRTDGNWSRAPSLSVIMRLPFAQVHNYVETTVRDIEKENDPSGNASEGREL